MSALIERIVLSDQADAKQFQQFWRELVNHCCRVNILEGASLHVTEHGEWLGYYRSQHKLKTWCPEVADLPERLQGPAEWLSQVSDVVHTDVLEIREDALLPATGEATVF